MREDRLVACAAGNVQLGSILPQQSSGTRPQDRRSGKWLSTVAGPLAKLQRNAKDTRSSAIMARERRPGNCICKQIDLGP